MTPADFLHNDDFADIWARALIKAHSYDALLDAAHAIGYEYSNHFRVPTTLSDIFEQALASHSFVPPQLEVKWQYVKNPHRMFECAFVRHFDVSCAFKIVENAINGTPLDKIEAQLDALQATLSEKLAQQTEALNRYIAATRFEKTNDALKNAIAALKDQERRTMEQIDKMDNEIARWQRAHKCEEATRVLQSRQTEEKRLLNIRDKRAKTSLCVAEAAVVQHELKASLRELCRLTHETAEVERRLKRAKTLTFSKHLDLRAMLHKLGIDRDEQPDTAQLSSIMMWALKFLHVVDRNGHPMCPLELLSVHTSLEPFTKRQTALQMPGFRRFHDVPSLGIFKAAMHLTAFLVDVDGHGAKLPLLFKTLEYNIQQLAVSAIAFEVKSKITKRDAECALLRQRPPFVHEQQPIIIDAVHAAANTFYAKNYTRYEGLCVLFNELSLGTYLDFGHVEELRSSIKGDPINFAGDVFKFRTIEIYAEHESKEIADAFLVAYYERFRRALRLLKIVQAEVKKKHDALALELQRQKYDPEKCKKIRKQMRFCRTEILLAMQL